MNLGMESLPVLVREKIELESLSGCWEWQAHRNPRGYGRYSKRSGGRSVSHWAHRYVYELLRGPIPAGLVLDHLCRNHGCVSPEHLEPVTQKENNARGLLYEKGREYRQSIQVCPAGHDYDEENTYIRPDNGGRGCKKCRRRQYLECMERKRQARDS